MECDGQCFYLEEQDRVIQLSPKMLPELEFPPALVEETSTAIYHKIWPWQTRLLRLEPVSPGSECNLIADLVTVNLVITEGAVIADTHEAVTYDAMSYTWGPPKTTRPILVSGHILPITSSCEVALMRYRSTLALGPGYIWIDAVCINQFNEQERSEQVAKMLQIFEKAMNVFVWLGPQSEDSDIAMLCLEAVNDLDSKIRNRSNRRGRRRLNRHPLEGHSSNCVNLLSERLQALENLYSRPWLGRTWVRQEVFAARSLSVHCGSKSAHWAAFLKAGRLLKDWKKEMLLDQDPL
jgi:hypothetical protein